MRAAAACVIGALVLAGCSHSSSTTYDSADVGRTIETTPGTVISSRTVKVSGETNAAGPLAGGALGGAGSALAFQGSGLAAVIGAVVGAGVGYVAQQRLNDREGIEYVLEMDDGRTVTLVQNRATDEEQPLPDGTPVLVQVSGQYTRVIEDPRAERVAGGDWVDPDTLGVEPAAGDVPIGTAGEAPVGAAGDPRPLVEPPPEVSGQQ